MVAAAFLSYSHADEKALERLHKHLAVLKRDGTLPTWSDHAILPGDQLDGVISAQLERSQIFVALVSPDYLASQYCYDKEFTRALELAAAGRMRIVPVILEPCDWLSSPFKDFAALPKDGQPISDFTNPNIAYLNVVTGLRRIIECAGEGTAHRRMGLRCRVRRGGPASSRISTPSNAPSMRTGRSLPFGNTSVLRAPSWPKSAMICAPSMRTWTRRRSPAPW